MLVYFYNGNSPVPIRYFVAVADEPTEVKVGMYILWLELQEQV